MQLLKLTLLSCASLLAAGLTHADTLLGVYASADYWYVQGNAEDANHSATKQDIDQKGQFQVALSLEHGVPLLPNARIRYTALDVDSEQKILNTPTYNLKLNNSDFILYYEVLDNVVSADVGLAAKRLEGDVSFAGIAKRDVSATLPSVYASVGAKLPFTGLSAKAEALYGKNGSKQATDLSAEVKYDFIDNALLDVGAKLGYRLLNIDLEKQNGIEPQFSLRGPYLGVEAHF